MKKIEIVRQVFWSSESFYLIVDGEQWRFPSNARAGRTIEEILLPCLESQGIEIVKRAFDHEKDEYLGLP